jgi:hypothetical protein
VRWALGSERLGVACLPVRLSSLALNQRSLLQRSAALAAAPDVSPSPPEINLINSKKKQTFFLEKARMVCV